MFGAPEEDRQALADSINARQNEFEVWPECWESVQIFRCLQTQWRVIAGMGGAAWQGLDYAAVWATLRGLGVPNPDAVFADLRVMESAALAVLNAKAAKGA